MQNNHYWNAQNPHLTHEVLLHPVKVGVCCAVSAKRIVLPVWTQLSAVVFSQHVHLILIIVIFFFWGCLKDKVYNSNHCMEEEPKENIRRETANIPAEQLQGVNQNIFSQCEECLRVKGQYFQHLP
jgi:hypothetical protein